MAEPPQVSVPCRGFGPHCKPNGVRINQRTLPQSLLLWVTTGLNRSWYSLEVINAQVIPVNALLSNPFITPSQN